MQLILSGTLILVEWQSVFDSVWNVHEIIICRRCGLRCAASEITWGCRRIGVGSAFALRKFYFLCDDLNTVNLFTVFVGVIVVLYASGQQHAGTLFEISLNEFCLLAESG